MMQQGIEAKDKHKTRDAGTAGNYGMAKAGGMVIGYDDERGAVSTKVNT